MHRDLKLAVAEVAESGKDLRFVAAEFVVAVAQKAAVGMILAVPAGIDYEEKL